MINFNFYLPNEIPLIIQTMTGRINLNPNDYEAYLTLGKANLQQHQILQATKNFQKAKVLNPNISEPLYLLGIIYSKTDRINDSIFEFETLLENFPQYHEASEFLGNFYEKKGDYNKAIKYFKLALSYAPEKLFLYNKIDNLYRENKNELK